MILSYIYSGNQKEYEKSEIIQNDHCLHAHLIIRCKYCIFTGIH